MNPQKIGPPKNPPVFITVSFYFTYNKNNRFSLISNKFQPLKDIAVVGGQTARFECIVQSDSNSSVYWMKNNEVIGNSGRTIIEFRNGVCRLTIPNANQGGKY